MIYALLLSIFIMIIPNSLFATNQNLEDLIEETAMRIGFKRNLLLQLKPGNLNKEELLELEIMVEEQFKKLMPIHFASMQKKGGHPLNNQEILNAINYQYHLISALYAYLKIYAPSVSSDYQNKVLPEIDKRLNKYCSNVNCHS
ncbi:MAG: hypothetical protein ACTHJ4_00160 [Candidatus Nucleicultricaceae bacterium]